MTPSTNASYPAPQWWYVAVYANKITFVTNNGAGQWDHAQGVRLSPASFLDAATQERLVVLTIDSIV
jgi:hypothetical protein